MYGATCACCSWLYCEQHMPELIEDYYSQSDYTCQLLDLSSSSSSIMHALVCITGLRLHAGQKLSCLVLASQGPQPAQGYNIRLTFMARSLVMDGNSRMCRQPYKCKL